MLNTKQLVQLNVYERESWWYNTHFILYSSLIALQPIISTGIFKRYNQRN
jgi:hypothetical protein